MILLCLLNKDLLTKHEDTSIKVPTGVKLVLRLQQDVTVLQCLFASNAPIQMLERPVNGPTCMVYSGGDVSGEGFGSLTTPLGMPPPLLRRLLTGYDAWIATDNSTADTAFCKGRFLSPELDKVVLELTKLSLEWGFVLPMAVPYYCWETDDSHRDQCSILLGAPPWGTTW